MMIGPEPISKIDFMSVRLGMCQKILFRNSKFLPFLFCHEADETAKKIIGIMGSRGRFRMILNRKNRQFTVRQPLHCVVVEIEMGNFYRSFERIGVDREAMILRG